MAHLQSPNHGDWESLGVSADTGNWEENEGKIKKGNNTNLLVLQEDLSKAGLSDSPRHQLSGGKPGSNKTDPEAPKRPAPLKIKHVRKLSREEGDFQSTDSPSRVENAGRRTPFESPRHRYAGDSTPRRASRQGDRSLEVSPLHAHSHPPRLGGGGVKGGISGVSSPSWERRGSSEGVRGIIAPVTPSRSRLRPVTKGDETPDHSPAVPKFGDWDETDPSSADQFTQVFEKVRDEKQNEAGKVPVKTTEPTDPNSEKHFRNENSKGCSCFPWLGK